MAPNQHVDSLPTTKPEVKIKKKYPTARASLAALGILTSVTSLAACSPEAEVKPLEIEYTVGGIELPVPLAESRHNVLELCNTGEGAAELRTEWVELGFFERSGEVEFIDAVKNMADFKYEDPQAIVYYGEKSYPAIEAVAENCSEAVFLASSSIEVNLNAGPAKVAVEAFREKKETVPEADVDTLQILYNHLTDSYAQG